MALTTLTVPRRQVLALDFSNTTQLPGTGINNVMFAHSNQTQYPVVSSTVANVAADNPDVATGAEPRFGNLLLNGSDTFGIYFPSSIEPGHRAFTGAGNGTLNEALTSFVLTIDAGDALDSPPTLAYRSLSTTLTSVALSQSYFPVDGTITCQSGTAFPSSICIAPVYTLGMGILGYQTAGNNVYFAKQDGTWYKAFVNDSDYDPGYLTGPVTTNDGTYNYTTVCKTPLSGTNGVYMSKWQPAALAASFVNTNYRIELDDNADDLVFQAATDTGYTGAMRVRGSTEITFITADETTEYLTEMTVFVFANDFSYYDRLDITSNGELYDTVYFRDINGVHYLVGTDSTDVQAYQILGSDSGSSGGDGGDGLTDTSLRLRVWEYKLDGHQMAVFRVGPSESLIYDLTTGQFSNWASPGRDNWRAHVGQNWIGMGPTTLARGFGSDVVCGDDVSGVLYVLDPAYGRDDRTTTGDDPFNREVTGLITVDGREVLNCGAVTMSLSLGNPSQAGATITLETSDDLGQNWHDHGSNTITAADYSAVVEWRALGLARAPGRLFKFTDNGAATRISCADLR